MSLDRLYYGYVETTLGLIEVSSDEKGLRSVEFKEKAEQENSSFPRILEAIEQLKAYFAGQRTSFDLELHLIGTDFQKAVWQELTKIPYGTTQNYGEIARKIGNPKASRAVGGANNKNKLAIIIPCHRVIGKKGAMVGYAGEIWRKESLLKLEGLKE